MNRSFDKSLNKLFSEKLDKGRGQSKIVSFATKERRKNIIQNGFKTLRNCGTQLKNVASFKGRHMKIIAQQWEKEGKSPSYIQNGISHFRILSEWIGKKGMIEKSELYVKDKDSCRRQYSALKDKTWSGKDINFNNIIKKVEEKDKNVAAQLRIQKAFGLRMKESALIKPHLVVNGDKLTVKYGTKGGRLRIIKIQNEEQKKALKIAQDLVDEKRGSLVPKAMSFKQWRQHYYYICRCIGLTNNELGVTSHGLRHEKLNEIYKETTGENSPVKGGNCADKEKDDYARRVVSEFAGHSRKSISAAYLGPVDTD